MSAAPAIETLLIDTHAHLTDPKFDPDRDAVIGRAREAGVGVIVEIADQESEWPKARDLARAHAGKIFWSAGQHPHYADKLSPGFAGALAAAAGDAACVAIGEIGLDYFKNSVPRADQQAAFRTALSVARDLKKPVVVHTRDAQDPGRPVESDMRTAIAEFFPVTSRAGAGVLHCFQGSLELAQFCIARGFFIGVDAPLTYPKADALRRLMADIPFERLVIETDCPYLPPHGRRGERNEPQYVRAVAEALAALKNVPFDEAARQTTENARVLYGI